MEKRDQPILLWESYEQFIRDLPRPVSTLECGYAMDFRSFDFAAQTS